MSWMKKTMIDDYDQAWELGYQQGYAAALRDAVLATECAPAWDDWEDDGHGYQRALRLADAVAAIEALGGSGNPDTPPSAENPDVLPGECVCDLIARVREDERSKTLKAASEALDVLDRWGEATYRHVVIDYDEAVAAIESLGDEDD